MIQKIFRKIKETQYLCVDDFIREEIKEKAECIQKKYIQDKKIKIEEMLECKIANKENIQKKIRKYMKLEEEIEQLLLDRTVSEDDLESREMKKEQLYLENKQEIYGQEIVDFTFCSLLKFKYENKKMYVYNPYMYKLEFITSIGKMNNLIESSGETVKSKKINLSVLIENFLLEIGDNLTNDLIRNKYNDTHLVIILNKIYKQLKEYFKINLPGFGGEFETMKMPVTFYRGQENSNYSLEPGLYRKESFLKNEHHLYKEIQVKNHKNFQDSYGHLELLTTMQHYGLPTRLLDVSTSPLVTLFFAVKSDSASELDGEIIIFKADDDEIKYFDSDTVEIISSIATLTHKEKMSLVLDSLESIKEYLRGIKRNLEDKKEVQKLSVAMIEEYNQKVILKKLNNEIEKEWGIYPGEINPFDLFNAFIVQPKQNNERIIRQQGAFIVFGLVSPKATFNITKVFRVRNKNTREDKKGNLPSKLEQIVKKQFIPNEQIVKYIIPSHLKKELKIQLANFGIDATSIYPDLANVSDALKQKYSE